MQRRETRFAAERAVPLRKRCGDTTTERGTQSVQKDSNRDYLAARDRGIGNKEAAPSARTPSSWETLPKQMSSTTAKGGMNSFAVCLP